MGGLNSRRRSVADEPGPVPVAAGLPIILGVGSEIRFGQGWPIWLLMTDIFLMDAIRSGILLDWELDPSSEASKTPPTTEPVPARPLADGAVGREDLPRMMDPPNIKQTPASPGPEVSEPRTVGDSGSPRLRLAGTEAGPLTDEVRRLLELRAQVLLMQAQHVADADLIRGRLARGGRQDPIAVVTGDDAFTRTERELARSLAGIDEHLARSRPRPTVETETSATDLLRRS